MTSSYAATVASNAWTLLSILGGTTVNVLLASTLLTH
jgi:hypothetical protein